MNRFRVVVLGAVCAAMIFAMATAPDANAVPSALSANGSGTETDNCPGPNPTCTGTLTTNSLIGKFIGKSSLSLSLTIEVAEGITTPAGGTCNAATGSGQINTANKSVITVNTIGTLCNVGGSGSARVYNATYFINGGTLHFPNAAGTGLFVASIDTGGNALVTFSGGLIK